MVAIGRLPNAEAGGEGAKSSATAKVVSQNTTHKRHIKMIVNAVSSKFGAFEYFVLRGVRGSCRQHTVRASS